MNSKYNDAYDLLINSDIVSSNVKHLLQYNLFLKDNKETVVELAKLLFIADSIDVIDNVIVAKKSIKLSENTISDKIVVSNNMVYNYLVKIKNDTLNESDLQKLNELQAYSDYWHLYRIINEAIKNSHLFKDILDSDCNMSLEQLEQILNNA